MKFDEKIMAFHDFEQKFRKETPLTLERVRTFIGFLMRIFPKNYFKKNILNILIESINGCLANDFRFVPYKETANTTITTDFLTRRYAEAITQNRCHWIRIY